MDKPLVPQPDRESYVKHRRDVNRQILLPVILVTVIGAALAILVGVTAYGGNSAGASLWADIATIWLVIPIMVMMLVILALTVAMVYGLTRLLKVSPHYTGLVQEYALWFNAKVTQWTDKLIDPVLHLKAWLELFIRQED